MIFIVINTTCLCIDSENAIKVRVSLKAALGHNAVRSLSLRYDQSALDYSMLFNINIYYAYFVPFPFQYQWNANELYLFKASMAFAMRQYYLKTTGKIFNFMSVSNNEYIYLCVFISTSYTSLLNPAAL